MGRHLETTQANSEPSLAVVGGAPDPSAVPLKVEPQDGEADAEGEADADGEEDTGEPMAKRRRMDVPSVAQHQPLDDEAVLQLAAHGDSGPGEHYHPE